MDVYKHLAHCQDLHGEMDADSLSVLAAFGKSRSFPV